MAPRPGLKLHPSDNRVELDRARAALDMAAAGRRVVVVSSGDPGVFAMASALFEALEGAPVFSHYLSSDGAFHSGYGERIDALEERVYARRAEHGIPATLLLTHGSSAPSNAQAVQQFALRLRARNYPQLKLITAGFPAGHLGMDPLAFEDALARFL